MLKFTPLEFKTLACEVKIKKGKKVKIYSVGV